MESSYDQVVEKLKKALPSNLHCPMCGGAKFEVVRGWSSTQIQSEKTRLYHWWPGYSVPYGHLSPMRLY